MFFFIVFMYPSNILTSPAWTRSWCVPCNFKPSCLNWNFLVAYSKSKQWQWSILFQTFLNRDVRQMLVYLDCAVLLVSCRHKFISLTSFIGILNWKRILYKTSLLTQTYAFLKSIKSWCTASLCSHFSQVMKLRNGRKSERGKCSWCKEVSREGLILYETVPSAY